MQLSAPTAMPASDFEGEAVIDEIARFVTSKDDIPTEVLHTAALCLFDAIGCAIGTLDDPEARRLLGPYVEGTSVPLGARVLGTGAELDPVKCAFDTSLLIRWLDFSDTTVVGGHSSDNIGAVLAVADYMDRLATAAGKPGISIRDVLFMIVKAYEIHGAIAAANRFDRPEIGLDHVVVVKIASTAVSCALMGGTYAQVRDAVASAWVDGQGLNLCRHVPNTTGRKGWAGPDAASRGVLMAWMTMRGEKGPVAPLSTPVWGVSDVYLDGAPVKLNFGLGTFFMENVIFKLFPVQRNASTAVEAAIQLHEWFRSRQDRIDRIHIETHDEAMQRIVKTGPLTNRAARDHCLQYAVAVSLLKGALDTSDYSDAAAADPRIDELRALTTVCEHAEYTRAHHDLSVASCASAITLTTRDGETSPRVEVLYPLGDGRRRAEAMPALSDKFRRLTSARWSPARQGDVIGMFSAPETLSSMRVGDFIERLNHV